jgi:tetratricopeptide (TPR) repeat protein
MANPVQKYPVPLIFKKIHKDKLSGELIVIHDNFTKRLLFVKGKLSFAHTTIEKERLGDLLVALGKISRDQLAKVTKIIDSSDSQRKVGEVLVEFTALNMHDIYHALLYQIKTIAASTFTMTEGEWRFIVKNPTIKNRHKFNIRVEEFVQEGIKGMTDFSYFKRRFSLRAPVTTTIPEESRKYITAHQMKIYLTLSNYTNEPLMNTFNKIDIPDEDLWRHIVVFYLLNTLDFVEFTVDEEANKNIEEVNDLHKKLASEQMDFYQLLGLKSGADIAEVKKSYFDFSKRYHPDRIIAAPDSTIKLRANEVFAEINRAYDTLSNEEKKQRYDKQGFKETPSKDEERAQQSQNARSLYLKANTLFKLKKFFEAGNLMEEAVRRDGSKASYYLLLGLCHSKLPATKNRAERCLLKAAEMEPWNADHMFALGELYKSENLIKKAQVYFDKALEINMEHTLAGKAKEDLAKLFGKKKSLFSIFSKKK